MRKTTKDGFADAGQILGRAMQALRPDADPYTNVQLAIDDAIASTDPAAAAASIRRAQLILASIAASPKCDFRRHRAIQQCLRELSLDGRIDTRATPLTTRGAR